MALVSPGIQISINDQSQYVSNAVGSVPLVVLATSENKTYNGALAAGTSKANAGKLQSFTSQRDLVTAFGTPSFRKSAAGTPIHAGELNEYGLMTAYSALGLGNQLYAIRADIDLDQLVGTSVRPSNTPADGTYWLDVANTEFGIYSLNRTNGNFDHVTPLLITTASQVELDNTYAYDVPKPRTSVGAMGSYALVLTKPNGTNPDALRLFKKTSIDSVSIDAGGPGPNAWVQVGSTAWQYSVPVVTSRANPTLTSGTTLVINGATVTLTGTSVSSLVDDINNHNITGVKAAAIGTKLALFASSAATSGKITIQNGTMNVNSVLGITTGDNLYFAPYNFYGDYAHQPDGGWFTTDSQPRPTGSIWWKLGSTGNGLNVALKEYSSASGSFTALNTPIFFDNTEAIYGLDPIGGGVNIQHGQTVVTYSSFDTTSNGLRLLVQRPNTSFEPNGEATAFTGTPITFTSGDSFTIDATAPGIENTGGPITITLGQNSGGTTAADFVTEILAANIPYITASVTSTGTISITHETGGQILLAEVSGTPLQDAGFETDATGTPTKGSGYRQNKVTGIFNIGKFAQLLRSNLVEISASAPYASPSNGTYWYYSNAAEVDIMINDNGWKGYKTVSKDSRGYVLTNTDDNGVIVSATQPTSQATGGQLVGGDLWLDTSDLENYPALYRYTGTMWTAIDKTDQITSNGIVFADARWDTDGTMDPITDDLPAITDLLSSNYIDLDAPDYRLYPRGALLFNTRRSGYNVKKFVTNYYNDVSFPDVGSNSQGYPSSLPTVADAWVSASGLNANGSMKAGTVAQRAIVVAALSSAVDSNLEIREDLYQFNLLVAPGYPELIDNLVTLNTDRGETAFVIGDTPMTLPATTTAISNWNKNTDGNGLATASPYLGVYYPSGLTTDLSGNAVAVPASYSVLRTFLYSDNVSYPWFAPAGTHRGLVSNIQDVGYVNANTGAWVHNSIGQGLRDALYTLSINPITQLPGVGIVVWGQETKSGTSTARNRVNVVRLENYLRNIFKSVANGFLFEPNDQITRKSISTQIESALHDILSKRGLYDFLVVCDGTNNTASTIANNQLYVDVAIEPARDVEFIYIPIALYNPGALANLGTSST